MVPSRESLTRNMMLADLISISYSQSAKMWKSDEHPTIKPDILFDVCLVW